MTVSFPPRLDKYPAPCDSSESWLALPLSLAGASLYTIIHAHVLSPRVGGTRGETKETIGRVPLIILFFLTGCNPSWGPSSRVCQIHLLRCGWRTARTHSLAHVSLHSETPQRLTVGAALSICARSLEGEDRQCTRQHQQQHQSRRWIAFCAAVGVN